MTRPQRTIAREAEIDGQGLFSGQSVHATLRPAEPGTGLVFRRTDLGQDATVAAGVQSLAKRFQRTALQNGDTVVETAEHLLAAAFGLRIDNLVVDLNAPELPAGDGSASDWVRLLGQAGVVEQEAERPVLKIVEPVTVREGHAVIAALPGPDEDLSITYHLDYGPDGAIPPQVFHVRMEPETFAQEVAPSRTYILESEIEDLRNRGYGASATYDTLLVFGADGPISNTLRWPDEAARHKTLDLVGDLCLAGCDLQGRIVAMQSGHVLNHRLIRRLLEQAAGGGGGRPAVTAPVMDITQIMDVLPHRYPFLMIDRIVELEEGVRVVGIKNVTFNEHFFQGHYPGMPIMPGVLIVEAMAQVAGVVLLKQLELGNLVAELISMDRVKLRKSVHPGDQLRLEAEVLRAQRRRAEVQARAWVGDQMAAEAKIRFMLVPVEQE